jgi:hypothetical protein
MLHILLNRTDLSIRKINKDYLKIIMFIQKYIVIKNHKN